MVSRLDMTSGAIRAVLTLFMVTLLLFGANLLFTAHEANRVSAASASVTQLCQAGNESRAEQVSLWGYLVTISKPPPHETRAAARARLKATRAFLAYVQRVFAPRNCQAPLTTRRQP